MMASLAFSLPPPVDSFLRYALSPIQPAEACLSQAQASGHVVCEHEAIAYFLSSNNTYLIYLIGTRSQSWHCTSTGRNTV